ncbi:MAG: hypothetical protein ACI8UO_006463 [Verrucomicrobiales bacterium]|jgi:hypothetical protein
MFTYSQAERLSLGWIRTGYIKGVFSMMTAEDHERLDALSVDEKKRFMREIHRWIGGDPKARKPAMIFRDSEGTGHASHNGGAGTTHEMLSIFATPDGPSSPS